MGYEVKLDIFEGPLDLLLHLIKKNEIDIYNIPISLITEQYLQYLEVMKSLNLDLAGEYLLLAATLVHIKSKMLLPIEEEESEEEPDPRAELVRQLLDYQTFKEAAVRLDGRLLLDRDVFTRGLQEKDSPGDEDAALEVGVFELIDAFRRIISDGDLQDDLKINGERISLAEVMNDILERLARAGHLTFTDLLGEPRCRQSVIYSFLAILELVKQRMIKVYQVRSFGEIRIFLSVEV